MTVQPLSTALKCLELLNVVATQSTPVRISELGRMIGETRATTYQRMLTLTAAGWLERLEDGSYRLTTHACRIANAALEQAGFGERALPILNKLKERTGETCTLVTLEDDRLVIAQRVMSHGALRADPRIGAELSFRDSASGKIWLAFGPKGLADRLRNKGVAMASKAELKRVAANRFALGGGGHTLQGVSVMSVPVLDGKGRCAASLSVVCPETRFDLEKILVPVQAAAAEAAELMVN
jgi:IclR family transcriptional regulator, KDG regulon repressor